MKPPRSSVPATHFGLLAWLEETRVALPLKGVECRFEVTGAIACVALDQIYHQNAARPLDCTYTFPLPAGAAVYRCELHVNGRVIRARVEAEEAARKIYREQKAAGRRAALVETERENLFTLSLGNVQPGDIIVVRLAWFQELDRTGDALRLLVPTCPGVRYIPGKPLLRSSSGRGTVDDTDEVPDASRMTPPRIDALHPDAAYFAMEGRLALADVENETLSSPTHSIFVRRNEVTVHVELSSKADVPDRDFVLTWEEPKARRFAPQSWHWKEGKQTYALIQLRAPADVPVATSFPQDFYFLVDRSGSMAGAKWVRTCEALRAFVGLLGSEDRVWITFFETNHCDFAEVPMLAAEVHTDPKFQQIVRLGTAGGTELRPAAEHVLGKVSEHSTGRRTTVVLITDGQVGNDSAILKAFQRLPEIEVHTFGIDTTVNDAFLKALARQHRGGCWLQTPNDDIAGTIAALGDRLRRPVMTDLQLRGSWVAGSKQWPNLYAGQIARVTVSGQGRKPITITGRLPDGREHRLTVDLGSLGSEAVKLLWAKERIATLLAAHRRNEAIALAIQHNLICAGAAFVAWDEAEQVQIAGELLIQPSLQAVLMDLDACERLVDAGFSMRRLHSGPRILEARVPGSHESNGLCEESMDPDLGSHFLTEAAKALGAMETEGVPPTTRAALTQWAVASEPPQRREPWSRWQTLSSAFANLETLRSHVFSSEHREQLERKIRQALEGTANQIVKRLGHLGTLAIALLHLQKKFRKALAPEEVRQLLIGWLIEPDLMDGHRLTIVQNFTKTLDQLPFSAGMAVRAQHWRAFLDSSLGSDAAALPKIGAWLAEMAGLADHQGNREPENIPS